MWGLRRAGAFSSVTDKEQVNFLRRIKKFAADNLSADKYDSDASQIESGQPFNLLRGTSPPPKKTDPLSAPDFRLFNAQNQYASCII